MFSLGFFGFQHSTQWHAFHLRQALSACDFMPGATDPGFDTLALHAGAAPDPATGARAVPIHLSTSFVFQDSAHAASLFNMERPGHVYSRISNPTTAVLEERIATLEGGRGATCTASGHSAQLLALFPLLSPGDEFVSSRRLYGGSITQFTRTFQKFGWKGDRKSTRLNSSHSQQSRMPSSA